MRKAAGLTGRSKVGRLMRRPHAALRYAAQEAQAALRFRGPSNLIDVPDPLLIGGTGGSGTRVFAAIVRSAGYHIGSQLNDSLDSLPLARFYQRWGQRLAGSELQPLSIAEERSLRKEFDRAVLRHRAGIGDQSAMWAIKNPRSILFLPFLANRFPSMRFLHVVRDGRDLAFSTKRTTRVDAEKYAPLVLPRSATGTLTPTGAAEYWSFTNVAAKAFASTDLRDRYLMIRLETLCENPQAAVRDIFSFLGIALDDDSLGSAAAIVNPSATLGRWRQADPATIQEIERSGRLGLETFGYSTSSNPPDQGLG